MQFLVMLIRFLGHIFDDSKGFGHILWCSRYGKFPLLLGCFACVDLDRVEGFDLSDPFVTGVTLVKLPYAQESRQQDPVTLWSI